MTGMARMRMGMTGNRTLGLDMSSSSYREDTRAFE
jgi:hypothetical protein